MERLKQEHDRYYLFGVPVEVKLVYGPVIFTYEFENNDEISVQDLLEQIKKQEKIDITNFSNSYITTGISIIENNKKIRHEFVWFCFSKPDLN